MKKHATIYRITTLFILVLFSSANSFAAINAITVNTNKKNLTISAPNTVTITWRVSVASAAASVQSAVSAYAAGNITLSSPNSFINGISNGANPATFTFTETLNIPQAVVLQAQQMGFSSIQYRRTFTDSNQGSAVAITTFSLVGASSSSGGSSITGAFGASGGSLNINRNSLQFGDQSLIKVAQKGDSIIANAELNYTGSGLIRAVWEIARPESTRGTPVFATLKRISQFLSSSNVNTFTLKNLPTDAAGFYLVRFRIISPITNTPQPTLQYVIQKKNNSNKTIVPGALKPLSPAEFSSLDESTAFSWQPVSGAKAYRLEFYQGKIPAMSSLQLKQNLNANSKLVTGVLVSALKTKVNLSMATRNRLQQGKVYNWQILAIGERGLIAASKSREIKVK